MWARETQTVGTFILSEIRELRQFVESRDQDIRRDITAIRDAINTMGTTQVKNSHVLTDMEGQVTSAQRELEEVKGEVTDFKQQFAMTTARKEGAWQGPKSLVAILIALGAAASAVIAVKELFPTITVGW